MIQGMIFSDSIIDFLFDILDIAGNEHMKQQQYEQAISCYSKAINLDGGNSIYYCNR